MTNHPTVLCTPAHRDTSPTLKGSWSHVHRGLSLYTHLASHGNLEPSPLEFFTQGFTPSRKGPGGGSAACPEDGEEKDGEDGEEKAGEKEGQLKKHECGVWTSEKG